MADSDEEEKNEQDCKTRSQAYQCYKKKSLLERTPEKEAKMKKEEEKARLNEEKKKLCQHLLFLTTNHKHLKSAVGGGKRREEKKMLIVIRPPWLRPNQRPVRVIDRWTPPTSGPASSHTHRLAPSVYTPCM